MRSERTRSLHGVDVEGAGIRLHIEGEHLTSVEAGVGPGPDGLLVPGFVDLQVNGIADVDCAAASPREWDRAAALLAATGVTAWLPTLVSQPLDTIDDRLHVIGAAMERHRHDGLLGARMLGVHLEGPFLGGRPGAHRRDHIIDADLDWLGSMPDHVRVVTLAPEQEQAAEAIRLLTSRGVVASLGHSGADLAIARQGFDAGARLVTHLFNAMPTLHHRAPGLVGAALADDRVTVGLIADGVHVHESLLPVVFRAKGAHRVAVVTDAVAADTQRFGDLGIRVIDGAPRLPDGTIAGSVLTMDQALRNLVDAGVGLADAVTAMTATPAAVLADPMRGRLEPGARADIVCLDPSDLRVRTTLIGGRDLRG